jgi:NADH:ubiquinone oxidoreductase subunit 4 (subunit M)
MRTQIFVDLNSRELAMLIPIVLLLLITGIVPSLFIPLFETYVTTALQVLMMTIGAK